MRPATELSLRPAVAAAAMVLLLLATAGSLLVGDVPIGLGTVCDALFHYNPEIVDHVLIRDGRLPRAVADLLVGASLAIAGAIMQAVTRNPLASPGIMGLNTGASFATVLAFVLLPALPREGLVLVSIAGAALGRVAGLRTGVALARRADARPPGADGPGGFLAAGRAGQRRDDLQPTGPRHAVLVRPGTEGVRWFDIGVFLPLAAVGFLGAVAISPAMGVMALGDHVAGGLGQRTRLTQVPWPRRSCCCWPAARCRWRGPSASSD